MPGATVFCGAQSCSKPAVGAVKVTLWQPGDEAAQEKTMPVCAEDRGNCENAALKHIEALPDTWRMELGWTENLD